LKKVWGGFLFRLFLVLFSPIILYTDLHNEQMGGGGNRNFIPPLGIPLLIFTHWAFQRVIYNCEEEVINEFFHRRATTTITTTGKCALKHICEESSAVVLSSAGYSFLSLIFLSKRMERALE
jgi:hypothetical protein